MNTHLCSRFLPVASFCFIILFFLFIARYAHAQITFHSLSFLIRRLIIHLDGLVIRDHNHDVLGQILGTLALQQDIIDVFLLHCDFEALVLIL